MLMFFLSSLLFRLRVMKIWLIWLKCYQLIAFFYLIVISTDFIFFFSFSTLKILIFFLSQFNNFLLITSCWYLFDDQLINNFAEDLSIETMIFFSTRDVNRSNDFRQMSSDRSDEWRKQKKRNERRKGFKISTNGNLVVYRCLASLACI